MTQGICELLWLKIILEDLKIKWDDSIRLLQQQICTYNTKKFSLPPNYQYLILTYHQICYKMRGKSLIKIAS